MSIGHQLRFALHASETEIVHLINANYETNQLESIRYHKAVAIFPSRKSQPCARFDIEPYAAPRMMKKRERHDLIKIFI